MPCSYYIYYRVRTEHHAACRQAVGELLADVERITGIRGRLLTKRGEPGLWMEVYEPVKDAARFEQALQESVERSGMEALLQAESKRHTECFDA